VEAREDELYDMGEGDDTKGNRNRGKCGDGRRRKTKAAFRRCGVCGFQTRFESSMIRHQRVHTGEKPFVCRFCDFRSSQRCHAKRHELLLHGDEVQRLAEEAMAGVDVTVCGLGSVIGPSEEDVRAAEEEECGVKVSGGAGVFGW
jgi:hypothetical protein